MFLSWLTLLIYSFLTVFIFLATLKRKRLLEIQKVRKELDLKSSTRNLGLKIKIDSNQDHIPGLPGIARRFLHACIKDGSNMVSKVELKMTGTISLSHDGKIYPFSASEILTPWGFVWDATIGTGLNFFHGFDFLSPDSSGLEYYVGGVFPVVRLRDDPHVRKSCAGRTAMESIFLPVMLIPQGPNRANWKVSEDDPKSCIVTLTVNGNFEDLEFKFDENAIPIEMRCNRWSHDAGEGIPGLVSYRVDYLTDRKTFEGYTIPTKARVFAFVGTEKEFEFLSLRITDAKFS